MGRGRAARLRKPDSGHTGTISLTVHMHRTAERHETPDQVRSNAMNVRFQGVRPQTNRHDQPKLAKLTRLVVPM